MIVSCAVQSDAVNMMTSPNINRIFSVNVFLPTCVVCPSHLYASSVRDFAADRIHRMKSLSDPTAA